MCWWCSSGLGHIWDGLPNVYQHGGSLVVHWLLSLQGLSLRPLSFSPPPPPPLVPVSISLLVQVVVLDSVCVCVCAPFLMKQQWSRCPHHLLWGKAYSPGFLARLQDFVCTAHSACLVHRHPGSARCS